MSSTPVPNHAALSLDLFVPTAEKPPVGNRERLDSRTELVAVAMWV